MEPTIVRPLGRKLFGPKEDGFMSILTYNVLSDSSAKPKYFPKVDPSVLLWKNRREIILRQIIEEDADVVCLQEIDHFRDDFLPGLGKQGYEGVWKQRTGGKKDGCCIFFKRDKFYMIQEFGVDFNEIAEKLKDKTNAHSMITCNVAQILFLQPVDHDKVVCFANCHLWWEPRAALVREYQLQFLLLNIKEAKEKFGYKPYEIPTFICGDFNEELNNTSKLNELFTKLGYLSSYTPFFNQEQNEKKRKNKPQYYYRYQQ